MFPTKKLPDSDRFSWTNHAQNKMQHYQLSVNRVKRVTLHPDRIEYGVAPKTIAVMQTSGTKKHPYEIWTMYQLISKKTMLSGQKFKIISAWRYPGISPRDKAIPIPDDIKKELGIE
ncbi:MAG: hypothetical protein NTW73_02865 [Candidatus Parcubacteria bacterium]|nr:hypothetical protein [Candidatus Parcubacteria bacterium]